MKNFYNIHFFFLFFLFFISLIFYNFNFIFSSYFFFDRYNINFILFFIFLFFIIINLYSYLNFEISFLLFTTLIGSLVVISTNNLFILYLGLEIQTFSIYILISKTKLCLKSSEAGLKYFILGSISSGFFLLGLCIIFLCNFSLNIQDFLYIYYFNSKLYLSSILIILSLFFKIGLFPLHFWIPDIYEGSSWQVIGLISSIPKISVIFVLFQLKNLTELYFLCSIFSIIIGSLGAINQTKIKRLIAYSGISHVGFILLILNISNQKGLVISNIYIYLYILNLLAIIILIIIINYNNINYIIDLTNNKYMSNMVNLSWVILLLSISGIPPLLGFIPKWLVIWTIIEENFFLSIFICLLFTGISIFYYIRLIKIIFFQLNPNYFIWEYIIINNNNINNNILVFLLSFILYLIIFMLLNPGPLFLILSLNLNFIN